MTPPRPPAPRRAPWRGRVGALLVVLVAGGVLLLSLVGPDDEVRVAGLDPADGARLTVVPSAVTVTFTGDFRPSEYHLSVSRADGGPPLVTGGPRVAGQTLATPIAVTEPGWYLIGYHVSLPDGGQLSGVTRFQVAPGAALPNGPAPTAAPAARAAGGHVHGSKDPLGLALVLLDLVLLVALSGLLLHRSAARRRAVADRSG
ncbi:copper resistance CopC family protein [Micromonospora sp. NPDC050980]|uniref:copper resistance CopC family protein n=1 Tax=Micromonospora sp. NPDC050980 TaxID=3155161 RepID=UPI0033CAED65